MNGMRYQDRHDAFKKEKMNKKSLKVVVRFGIEVHLTNPKYFPANIKLRTYSKNTAFISGFGLCYGLPYEELNITCHTTELMRCMGLFQIRSHKLLCMDVSEMMT